MPRDFTEKAFECTEPVEYTLIDYWTIGPCPPLQEAIHATACPKERQVGDHTLDDCLTYLMPCDVHSSTSGCFAMESEDEKDCSNRLQWRTTRDEILFGNWV